MAGKGELDELGAPVWHTVLVSEAHICTITKHATSPHPLTKVGVNRSITHIHVIMQ